MLGNLEVFTRTLFTNSLGSPLHLLFLTDPVSRPILQVVPSSIDSYNTYKYTSHFAACL